MEQLNEYNHVVQHKNDTRKMRKWCETPHSDDLLVAQARKSCKASKILLSTVMAGDDKRQELLHQVVDDLDRMKKDLTDEMMKIEANYLQNLKSRENDRLETLSRMDSYVDAVNVIKREREKQQILIKIGLIMECLLAELEPYEVTLGHLSLQADCFKSKADTLMVRKIVLMGIRDSLNTKLRSCLLENTEIENSLFTNEFKFREATYCKLNLINKLVDLGIKSNRRVMDLESKIATLRSRATETNTDTAWFYWFLDWVLFDIIGSDALVGGIDASSSLPDKTQCIIEFYKNLKAIVAARGQLERSKESLPSQVRII